MVKTFFALASITALLAVAPSTIAHAGTAHGSLVAASAAIRVGPQQALTRVADAARVAKDGDVIEIEAGVYTDDVAIWRQSNITIRGVGGRARMFSERRAAEAKAIWVIKGDNVVVENIEFAGTRVPGRNGAGIRHEGGKLIVRHCLFEHNEMGILTWNNKEAELEVEYSEFRRNAGDEAHKQTDPGHQIYVGTIRRFSLRGSYVHRGAFGHLVKTRASVNHIYYNRLTDEQGGRASYELEFPSGGIAYVIGNIIQQSPGTDNPHLISFGVEGYRWPRNELYLVNNTLVDELPQGGVWLRVSPGADRVEVLNNLLVGRKEMDLQDLWRSEANHAAQPGGFANPAAYDYRLRRSSGLVGKSVDPGKANGVRLRPAREYVHPLRTGPVPAGPYNPGALQSVR